MEVANSGIGGILYCFLEGGELGRPEVVQIAPDGGEPIGSNGEEVASAVAGLVDESGLLQYGEVVRDGLLGDIHALRNVTDRERFVLDEKQDGAPVFIREGAE
jgi:hypothetical protein